ncbi:hypothetical protein SUGI_0811750 [Cryptomeria japonica]|nr:hypothetical protein SUGI_0811750 [Cryptomeria japonica]
MNANREIRATLVCTRMRGCIVQLSFAQSWIPTLQDEERLRWTFEGCNSDNSSLKERPPHLLRGRSTEFVMTFVIFLVIIVV